MVKQSWNLLKRPFRKAQSIILRERGSQKELASLLGRIGSLEVRLARTEQELLAAQELRYKVFYEEMSAGSGGEAHLFSRDEDKYDLHCDHLIVVDTERSGTSGTDPAMKIVGTYRLFRQSAAERIGGFYTQDEYDIEPLIRRHAGRRFLELGRSCVLPEYRTKRTVELLWHGIWAYVGHHKIDVMFGCASLEGTDIDRHQDTLQLLASLNPAPKNWTVRAQDDRYVDMNFDAPNPKINKRAMLNLPPLIKGYLRLGAYIGDGAVIDYAFGTTDVLIILPVENINPRYINYYGEDASRHAA